MSEPTCVPVSGPAPPPERPRIHWLRAGRALRRLISDSERTEEVFELIDALSGPDGERAFQAFARDPRGRALLAARPSLLDALSDRAALRALPEGTLGRAYANFMDEADLSADGLVQASERPEREGDAPEDPDRAWYLRRIRDMHDLWHVLTGYGRDEAGEVALLAFTHGQLPNRGIGVIVVVGALIGFANGVWGWPAYLRRARRRGREATGLQLAPYEEWLARPLEDVRRDLGVAPATVAHPQGIAVGSRGEEPRLIGPASTCS